MIPNIIIIAKMFEFSEICEIKEIIINSYYNL